ncbi:MAG: FAD-dependent oxidoreductase [bacterium]|nr:FAD-dependent oxidoreductase [bacterium]
MAESIYDIIIIGGGPAGITAGIYASRLNLKTLLITKSFGGQIALKAVAIENYPGFGSIQGLDLIQKMEGHLRSLNIEIKLDEVVAIEKRENIFEFEIKSKKRFSGKSVVITSGTEPKRLNIPGEKEFLGKGASYCALCDGPMFKNKKVAVIGGGNSAFETAVFMSNIAEKIYMLEYSDEVMAFGKIVDMAMQGGKTEIITGAKVLEIKGDKFARSIIYKDMRADVQREIEVEGVFIEIGYKPVVSYLRQIVEFNTKGEIKVNPETMETSAKGIFAAGDVASSLYKQIVISAGEGAKAALSAYKYIKGNNIEI